MRSRNKFDEMKIKMVMKLRGLTREAAIKELRLENREKAQEAKRAKRSDGCGHSVSAKGFFGIMKNGGEMVSAEEFFKED